MPTVSRRPRLVDVAEHAAVSLATASRALAGRAGVSAEVADRIRQIAGELGYVANPYARTLASGATSTVGLIVHQIDDPYFSEIAAGVIQLAAEQGLLVQICQSGRDPGYELQQLRHLIAQRVGIVLISGSGYGDPRMESAARAELDAFQDHGGRAAAIGRHALGVDAVLPDNEAGGHALAQHLMDLGHRRIAVAAGSAGLTTVADRLAGVSSALRQRGRSPPTSPSCTATSPAAGARRRRADPQRPSRDDGDHRAQRRDGHGRAVDAAVPSRAGTRADVGGRLRRRLRGGRPRTQPHHRPPADDRDGPHGTQPRAQTAHDPPPPSSHRAPAGRPRLDRARAQGLTVGRAGQTANAARTSRSAVTPPSPCEVTRPDSSTW